MVTDFLLAADRGEVTLLSLLDLSAAFDTVDHDFLINRLYHSFGLRDNALSWIKSFITGRTQTVRVGDQYSVYSEIDYGVSQGSVLGQILVPLYTADVMIIAYADDTQLYVHTTTYNCLTVLGRLISSLFG